MTNKSRLVSGRVPVSNSANVTSDRYQFLDLGSAEPNLGTANVGEILIYDTSRPGSRRWIPQSNVTNSSFAQANTATVLAQAAYNQANVTIGVDTSQNARMVIIENTDLSQNVRLNYSNAAITIIQGTDTSQNARMTIIEGTDVSQNTRLDYSNAAITIIQGTDVSQNARMAVIEGTDVSQNTRLDYSNTAITIIQGVDVTQNTRLTVIEGTDITQNTAIAATDGKMQSAYNKANTGGLFSGDVIITGNLIVNGVTTSVNTSTITTSDSLIKLANNNTVGDSVDIGFYGTYNSSGQKYAGLVRQAGSNFFLFKDITTDPTANTLPPGSLTGANTGILSANIVGYITSNGYSLYDYTTSLYNLANTQSNQILVIQGTDVSQNARMAVIEGTDVSQNTRLDYSNTAITIIQGVDVTQNAAIAATNQYATSAFSTANNAYTKANNALANTTGTFAGTLTVTGNVIANSFQTAGSSGNISGANFVYANTFVSSNAYIFSDGTVQTTGAVSAPFSISSYNQANTGTVLAQAAYNQANVTIGVDATQNTRLTVIEGTDVSQNTRIDYSNAAITIIQGVDVTQNTNIAATDNKMQFAYGQANTGTVLAQAGYNQANASFLGVNTAITIIQGVDVTQNTNIAATDGKMQSAYGQANTGTVLAQASYNQSNASFLGVNTAITIIQGVDLTQNTNIAATDGKMQLAYGQANTGTVLAQASYNQANVTIGVDATQNTRLTVIEGTDVSQNARMVIIEATDVSQNVRLDYSNSAITILQGVNAGQNTLIQTVYNTANVGRNFVTQGGTVSGNVSILGNLNVSGNISVIGNVTNLVITGNSGQFFGNNTTGFEALYAGIAVGYDFQPQTVLQTSGNFNGYSQINNQNINPGANASSDIVATAENGNEGDTFIDMGINSSNYSQAEFSLTGPNDGYLYVHGNTSTGGGNLIFSTMHQNDIIFSINGATTDNEVARFKFGEGLILKNYPLTFTDGTKQNTAASPVNYTQASFDKANSASSNTIVTQGVDLTQNTAIAATDGKMQSAYGQANTGTVLAQASYNTANNKLDLSGGVVHGDITANNLTANVAIISPELRSTGGTSHVYTSDIGIVSIDVNGGQTKFYNAGVEVPGDVYAGTYGGNRVSLGGSEAKLQSIRNATVQIQTGTDGTVSNTWTFNGNKLTFPDNSVQNTAFTGVALDQFARVVANSAGANTIVTQGVDAWQNNSIIALQSSLITINSNSAYSSAIDNSQNSRMTIIEGTDLSQNVSIAAQNSFITIIQGTDTSQNARMTIIEDTNASQNVRLDWSNTSIAATDGKMQSAYNQANTAQVKAQAAFDAANTAGAGVAIDAYARQTANAAYSQANTGLVLAQAAYNQANVTISVDDTQNTRLTVIEGTDVSQNARMAVIEGTDVSQNTRLDYSNTAITIIQGVDVGQNTRLTVIENTDATQNTNIAATDGKMQSAYNKANTGGTFAGDVTITGNLVVNGVTTSVNTSTITTSDSLIKLANNNTAGDTVDIGFYGTYNSSGQKYAGLVRQAGSNFFLFKDITTDPTANTLPAGSLTGANTGTLSANITGYITSNGYSLYDYTSTLYTLANTHSNQILVIQGTDTSQNARMTIIEGTDVGQNSRMTIIEATDVSQNTRIDYSNTAITILQGVNASQNVRLDYSNTAIGIIQGTDVSQNTRIDYSNTAITIIQGTDVGQNSRMTIIEATDVSQNTRIDYSNTAITIIQGTDTSQNTRIDYSNTAITILQGVNAGQNANIALVQTLANTDFTNVTITATTTSSNGLYVPVITVAANGRITAISNTMLISATSGYLANSIIFANTTGYLSNTANLSYYTANNTLVGSNYIANGNITIANTTTKNSATMIYNSTLNSIDFYFN